MTTIALTGFIVRETEKAVAYVKVADAAIAGVRPLWIPRKKISQLVETDAVSRRIATAQDGVRVGIPIFAQIEQAFAEKVGVA
jgi:hypothetical protein